MASPAAAGSPLTSPSHHPQGTPTACDWRAANSVRRDQSQQGRSTSQVPARQAKPKRQLQRFQNSARRASTAAASVQLSIMRGVNQVRRLHPPAEHHRAKRPSRAPTNPAIHQLRNSCCDTARPSSTAAGSTARRQPAPSKPAQASGASLATSRQTCSRMNHSSWPLAQPQEEAPLTTPQLQTLISPSS